MFLALALRDLHVKNRHRHGAGHICGDRYHDREYDNHNHESAKFRLCSGICAASLRLAGLPRAFRGLHPVVDDNSRTVPNRRLGVVLHFEESILVRKGH